MQEVLVFSDKSQPLNIDSPCSTASSSNVCDQFCFSMPQQNTPKCACAIGELDSNGRSCKQPSEYLIYSMETEIRSVNFPVGNLAGSVPWRPVTGLSRAIGIDFDYRENKILFTDLNQRKIGSFLVGSENPVIVDVLKNSMTNLSRIIISKPEGF